MKKRKIMAMLLAFAMVLACMPITAFADDEISYKDISIGNRCDMTFEEDESSQYFKLSVPESGFYRMYLYQDYTAFYNEHFWVALYTDSERSGEPLSELWCRNTSTMETDYQVFKLEAGTYYIEAHNNNSNGKKLELGLEFRKTDGYEIDCNDLLYTGQKYWEVTACNVESWERATADNVVSSDNSVVSVTTETWEEDGAEYKIFIIEAVKAGTVKLTVDYTTADGTHGQKVASVSVKKYPNPIKSLKVNGKKVNVSKNKYEYYKGKFKAKKVTVKLAMNKGWKIDEPRAYFYTKSGKEVKVKINKKQLKKMLANGTAFDFPKKYVHMNIGFGMTKGEQWIDYNIDFDRY